MNTNKICPIRCNPGSSDMAIMPECLEGRCAWWDRLGGSCWIASGADCIREAANQLNVLNSELEELAENHHAPVDLYRKKPAGKGEQT